VAKLPVVSRQPSDEGRDALITKLAETMNVVPSKELVDLARTLWVQAGHDWTHKRGPKPDVAKCITTASSNLRKVASTEHGDD
jgi:hypothetical protein